MTKPKKKPDDAEAFDRPAKIMPAHILVNTLEIMPVQQAFAGFAVDRGG